MKRSVLIFFICITSFLQAQDLPEPMRPKRIVNDFTQLFSPQQQQALEQKLRNFNDTSSTQIAIVTVPTLQGYAPSDYAQRLAEKWGVGQKGKDNGVLLLIKPKSRTEKGQVAIAVGYGLEGVIPDAIASRIIRNEIIPEFQQNNYYRGINKATDVLMQLAGGEFTAEQYARKNGNGSAEVIIIPILILFLLPLFFRRKKGYTTGSHGSGGIPPIFFGGFGGGGTEAGLYSFAYNVGMIFQVITNSMDTAWAPWFFEKMKAKEYPAIRRAASAYVVFVSIGAMALALISPEVILIAGGSKYSDSRYVTMPIVLSMYYAFLYTLPSSVEYYYKKTKLIALGTMLAAGMNILLNAVFIPAFGYVAAAYTTVACYLLYYLLHVVFAWWVHKGMVYDILQQFLWLGVVSVVSLVTVALTDLFWIRMGLLAALLGVCALWALRHRDQVARTLAVFRRKSA